MDSLALARWQFAITTVYHFLFVPITIGMSLIVAVMHSAWLRTRKPEWLRLTKFFGKLFVINFALGLVTGIVQEFQFGMNWSAYSRFVGDIFGAPLAFEALLAFFLESTFLGLWIFGWGRIPERLHVATIWLVHVGTVLSAYFILAANSFMQNPVGFRFNPDTGRAEMADFLAVLTNKVQLVTFPHVVLSAYMVGGAVVMGVAIYLMRREADRPDGPMYRKAARLGAVFSLVASLGVIVSGDVQGKIMTEVQPMKMAAAEALYETESNAGFSVFTIGSLDGSTEIFSVRVPGVLSFMATGSTSGTVEGINPLKEQAAGIVDEVSAQYGPEFAALVTAEDYTPSIPVAYWSFRLMMGLGFLTMAFSAALLWATRKGGVTRNRAWVYVAVLTPLAPVLANSFGWIFTEMGRQPWIVNRLMTTATGVSPSVSGGEVLFSMLTYTVVYAVLAVIEVKLFLLYVRRGAEPFSPPVDPKDVDEDAPLQFAY
ncbi:MAG TPA: cytochrome ubiquinol oxidase subunit I [Dermatophilaceae bacterium]|nr:cytochrome ubiquinol oxidase subunit I [Dermatophilaceae bacterium]